MSIAISIIALAVAVAAYLWSRYTVISFREEFLDMAHSLSTLLDELSEKFETLEINSGDEEVSQIIEEQLKQEQLFTEGLQNLLSYNETTGVKKKDGDKP